MATTTPNATELHEPTSAEVAEVIRRCRLPPDAQDPLEIALAQLVREIRADQAISDADRQRHRRERLAALKTFVKAQRGVVDAIETARPTGAEILRQLLAPELGLLLSSATFSLLLGMPVHPTLSMRERDSREATSRSGPYGLLEDKARFARQEIARHQGDQLLAALPRRLAARAAAELEIERLNVGGKPVDRPRRIALIRFLQLHEQLTGQQAPSQPSQAIVDFFERCFEAIGLPMPQDGLFKPAERLFALLRKARGAPP